MVVSSAFLRLLIFLLAISIPACASSSPAFLIMYSAYKLNKGRWRQGADALSMAERSYPTSEVRGSGLECQAATAQEWPRGAPLCPRSGTADKRSYPASEVRGGREEPPHAQGQGWRPGGATRGAVAAQVQEGLEEQSHVEGQEPAAVRRYPFQGKEQRLCFAGAAVKRYPMPKIRETQGSW